MIARHQSILHIAVLLAVPLAIAACDNSKKTAVARCALESAKINPTDARPTYIRHCMRLAGYDFYGGLCGGIYAREDVAACYVPASVAARFNDWLDGAFGF